MSLRPRLLAPALLCLALAIAGCGGSSSGSSKKSTTSTSSSGSGASSAPASSSGTVAIVAKNIQFVPQTVTVKVGQTIKWTNEDPIAHTVTSKSGASFDSPLPPGKTFSFKPTKAGTIAYVCTIHPNQTGTITVTQ